MTDPKAAQTELVARLHGILDDEPTTRVIPMFGSRAFMVRDKMVCCALKGGHLLAHVDPDDDRLRFWVDACTAFNRAQTIGSKPS